MTENGQFDTEDLDYCARLVRENARDMYLADLLLPESARHKANILHAFHVEITNITLGHGDPLASEVRLQWWSDVVAGNRGEEAKGHPVARPLLVLMEREPIVAPALSVKIEAHIFDIYQDPMPDRTSLEGWCGETRSILYNLVARFCGVEQSTELADVAGHVGCCMGIIGILENMPLLRSKNQVYIPSDLLQSVALTPESFLTTPREQHAFAIEGMASLAREHQSKAKSAIKLLDSTAMPAVRPLALADLYLKRFEKAPILAFSSQTTPAALRVQWKLLRGL